MDHCSPSQPAAKDSHDARRDAKPTQTMDHVLQYTGGGNNMPPNAAEPLHWPIADLVRPRAQSFPSFPTTTSTAVSQLNLTKSTQYKQDSDLLTMSASDQRVSLAGSDLAQGLVAKPKKSHEGMKPMERFLAETCGKADDQVGHHGTPIGEVSSSRKATKSTETEHGKSPRSRR